uniref:Galactose-3-O-sulfotransferase 4-like n=1 Tax=Taeniopygia guttata TaxID=59729 RepID=A0A674GVM7_TAEGU|nr:galactose-3-O-sulfotransferase 4 [Taeniopygia guttata]
MNPKAPPGRTRPGTPKCCGTPKFCGIPKFWGTPKSWGTPLGAALGVFVTLSFALGLLGGPLRPTRDPKPDRAAPCRPVSHIVFLKTHKTGGSSVVNLLSRYGESRQLRFALPQRYQFRYPEPFRAESVRGFRPGERFDIICHHMRFSPAEVQRVMPNDSFYFSIVRDPGTQGASAFSYFRAAAAAFRCAPSLDAFLAAPRRFFGPGGRGAGLARNPQWFDFGLPAPAAAAEVPALLARLERRFPLVLLAERFDESLVLLRHRLCWPRAAVDVFAHNARGGAAAPTAAQRRRLRAWNALDWALYSHFNRSFWRHVERFGAARLQEEAAELRRRRRRLQERCLRGAGPVPAAAIAEPRLRPFQPPGAEHAVLGFALRPGLPPAERRRCGRMALPELPYTDLLARRQFGNGNGTEWDDF